MKQERYQAYFEGKDVTVMGLGLLGRGVGDSKFLATHAKSVVITDKKDADALRESIESFAELPTVTFHVGGHNLEDFEKKDFILKGAGVPLDSEYILHAKNSAVPVCMSAALVSSIVMKECEGVTIIGVTGTRGKSTTTMLIAHILRKSGMRVHVGGNVRGVANLPLLDDIEDGDFLVLELDSWQLQGFRDMGISPHIAVFTNFLDDHMNYYKGDKEAYFADKAAIYRNQTAYDALIVSEQASHEIRERDADKDMIVASQVGLESSLLGSHNDTLVRLAYEATLQCGLFDEEVREAIRTFTAVDGRLQNIGTYRGVTVINDNNATTEDATVAGIRAVMKHFGKKPIVIVGGADKGLPITSLEETLRADTKHVVYLKGTGTDRITLPKQYAHETLEECIATAFGLADEGDVIIFSPSFASFSPHFNNEYERNDCFVSEVKRYA